MKPIYDIDFFKQELELIDDLTIRKLTRQTLLEAPKYIWYVPASITGKHHPPDDNDPGGLCWHLRKTAWVAYRMFYNLCMNTNIAVSAGLTHDITHRGLEDEPEDGYESYKRHGELAAGLLVKQLPFGEDVYVARTWEMIGNCVASHMGRWGETRRDCLEQTVFHLADVAASTKGLVQEGFHEDRGNGEPTFTVADIVGKRDYFKEVAGELVFAFGKKYLDIPLREVATKDDSYLRWMIKQGIESIDNSQGFPGAVIEVVKQARREVFERRRKENELDLQESLFDHYTLQGHGRRDK